MHTLVLLRHGESEWNKANRFTGWTDVDITEAGVRQARQAGALLRAQGYGFDLAFTSVLRRAIRTLWLVLDELGLMWLPVRKSWRLNERHYGALQGLNKAATARRFGKQQVRVWRRGYDTRPPAIDASDPRFPGHDPRYQAVAADQLPVGESLEDTVARVLPLWRQAVTPSLRQGRRVLIVAHGNSLRALVMHLDSLSAEEIAQLNIPTGVPLVYRLDDTLRAEGHFYLSAERSDP